MIIRGLRKPQLVEFCKLEKGNVFIYDGNVFLKIDDSNMLHNAYNFSKKIIESVHATDEVEHVPSELILHSPDWEEE